MISVTKQQALKVFERTYELLASPENWTQENLARDAYGIPIAPESSAACEWCLFGAMARSWKDEGFQYPYQLSSFLSQEYLSPRIHTGVAAWNDHRNRTHDEVVNLLLSVIKDLRDATKAEATV